MQIWTIAMTKGGVGKTTLATNLAVESALKGKKTLIIDLDSQESAVKWWQRREADSPSLIKIEHNELTDALNLAKKQKIDLVIIDTAGHDTLKHNESIIKATFCLIPCQPSIADIEAVYPTVEILKRTKKNFAFVLTRCPSIGQDQLSSREGLSGLGLVAKPYTVERKAYKHAYANGEGVSEYDPHDKASLEMKELYSWVFKKSTKLSEI